MKVNFFDWNDPPLQSGYIPDTYPDRGREHFIKRNLGCFDGSTYVEQVPLRITVTVVPYDAIGNIITE